LKKRFAGLLRPKLFAESIKDISVEALLKLGKKGVLVDLDNTLTIWESEVLPQEAIDWIEAAKKQGLKVCLLSNNKGERVKRLAGILGIPYVDKATKPRRRAFRQGMETLGTDPAETAVIGDQIFTDVLGGNRLKLYTILVVPISTHEFTGTKLMRIVERAVLKRLRRT
jgi:HAD superfamily phosphatase (TIGR01668 family)